MKKILLGLLVLLVLYAAGVGYVGSRLKGAWAARERQNAQVAALGEKVAVEVSAIDATGATLKDACKGKLTAGSRGTILEYVVKLSEGDRPALDGAPRLDGLICRMTWVETAYLEQEPMDPPRPSYGWDVALGHAVSPDDWSRELEKASRWQGITGALRYVAVTHFSELRPATPTFDLSGESKTFQPGGSRYRTRVVAFPSGATVCEGTGEGRLKQKEVIGHGGSTEDARSAMVRKLGGTWAEATVASPLDDLCDVGGKELCSATDLEIDAPDW